ncbi:MAG: ribosomal L7Ae/L30e/S12e/Gadd45 family protein [Oscillospiraceae bacterium]|nr:ribosomal L7Ae/L30e/S12e/Gadd45 family protein [Oscillospiraceae bacterium]
MDSAEFNKEKTVVGLRQAIKLLDEKNVKKAYIAKDADEHILNPLVSILKEQNIETIYVNSKKELGKMAKIDVSAAVAVETIK